MSVVGFMAYYASYLDLPPHVMDDDGDGATPVCLQCGYSYGAMVTTKLPPLATILAMFRTPAVHTAAADIRLRAQHLAEQQNRLWDTPLSPRRSLGMRVGGDGASPRGKSCEAKRPNSREREDKIRKGVKDILSRTRLVRQKSSHMLHEEAEGVSDCIDGVDHLKPFRSAYLIVSPPIGFVTTLATMSFANPFGSWSQKPGKVGGQTDATATQHGEEEQAEKKLVRSPSLAICGDQDHFVQFKKFRDWAVRLKGQEDSQFQDFEVAGAGHFWVEEGVFRQLRDAVGNFGIGLLQR
jgi:pimeloyl-ACP methyl ester carboxylesterase